MYIYPDFVPGMTNLSRSKSLGSLDDADQLKLCVDEEKERARGGRKRSSSGESTSPKKKAPSSRESPEYEEVIPNPMSAQRVYPIQQLGMPFTFSGRPVGTTPSLQRGPALQPVLAPLMVRQNPAALLAQQQPLLGLSGLSLGLQSPITTNLGSTFSWMPHVPIQTLANPLRTMANPLQTATTLQNPTAMQTAAVLNTGTTSLQAVPTPLASPIVPLMSPTRVRPGPALFSPPHTQIHMAPVLSPPHRVVLARETQKRTSPEMPFLTLHPPPLSSANLSQEGNGRTTVGSFSPSSSAHLSSQPAPRVQSHSSFKVKKHVIKKNTSSTLDFITEQSPPVFDSTMDLANQLVNVMSIYKKKLQSDYESAMKLTQGLGCTTDDIRHKSVNPELWSFFLDLLTTEERYQMIQWVNSEVAEFAILDNEPVAQMWGRTKNKLKMNYDTMSRAIRYYYNQGIIAKGNNMMFKYNYCYTEVALAKLCENAGWQFVESHVKSPSDVKFLHLLRRFYDNIKENGYHKSSLENLRGEWHSLARSEGKEKSTVRSSTPAVEPAVKPDPGRLFDEPEEMLS